MKIYTNIYYGFITYAFIIIALFASIFTTNSFQVALCTMIVFWIFIKSRTVQKFKINEISIVFFAWIIYNLFNYFRYPSAYFLRVLIFQIIVFIMLISSKNIKFEINNNFLKQSKFLSRLFFFIVLFSVFSTSKETSFNFFSIALVPFVIYSTRNVKFTFIILTFLYFLSSSRSTMLSMIVFLICYFFIKRIKTKKAYILLFLFFIIAILVIPELYNQIFLSDGGEKLNVLSRNIFGKNLFSGRNEIWIEFSSIIKGNEVFGLGGKIIQANSELGVSVHNLYKFLIGQGGIVLLSIFIFLMFSIYASLYKNLDNKFILITSAYIITILFRANFDLMLMANRFVESIAIWIPICISISIVNCKKGENSRRDL